jgi:hypothetical protein
MFALTVANLLINPPAPLEREQNFAMGGGQFLWCK